ncbi:MAG: hypothetical protein GMKNLPBB_00505 [Myxococcota bacterium]|nr:hypothetical protein [Myxococcota bacterium]
MNTQPTAVNGFPAIFSLIRFIRINTLIFILKAPIIFLPASARAQEGTDAASAAATSAPASSATASTAAEPAPAPAPKTAKPTVEITGGPGQGVTFSTGKHFSLNLKSRIQLRYQLAIPPEDAKGERNLQHLFNIGTARIWISGNVLDPSLTYMIQLAVAGRDYRDSAISPVFDAFVDWKAHRDFNIRAGQFFVPFDRLRTVREFALQLADRPRPVAELTLDRDVGVTVYSERFLGDRSPLAWRFSFFGGGGTNLSELNKTGGLLVGRLELRPLGPIDDDSEGDLERREVPGLAIGAAFAQNWNTNRLRSTTGSTFKGGVTDYSHAAGDLVFKWRGFALQSEYLWKKASRDEIASVSSTGAKVVEHTRSAHGWIAQTSYTFDPPFEVVARLTRMYALGDTDPKFASELDSKGQEAAAGLNYYFNGHRFKIQADWIARMPPNFAFDKADHAVHLQLDATF